MSPATPRFRVRVREWSLYEAIEEADDAQRAEECHLACNIDPLSRGIGVQNWL
jgi:hypothetical protein